MFFVPRVCYRSRVCSPTPTQTQNQTLNQTQTLETTFTLRLIPSFSSSLAPVGTLLPPAGHHIHVPLDQTGAEPMKEGGNVGSWVRVLTPPISGSSL